MFCVLAGVFHHYGLTDLITNFHHLQDVIRQSGLFGYTLYILLFIVSALCLIPGSILVIVGGVLFGPVTGTLISLVAATMASALSFMLARWLGRELLLKYVGHTATFQAIEKGIAHSGVDFLILTRLVPLFPYNIQNYAYGLTAIPFWSFTVISALTTLPGIFIYTLMSHELASEGISWAFIGKLSVAGLALFVLVQAAKAWARHKHVDPAPGHEYAGK
ncbi:MULTISPECIES: TVP38/TMEM64 family protein [Citrobacter]|uniref:TVP38/TMEM64 family protein n=1 Tax=Citrobacter TaxID=544 RepID=UPI0014859AEF|nr:MULTISPECIES: TVP38/TMEM64 family protein [Citrobacter]ELN4154850.1 TVP38/TMEM64 family protein [Citrobacter braakii]MBJ8896511.1 TVP38/TMEM64 family protein [Citrobacter braakii]MCZ5391930.1 TVP38/TMEM64 family protein [Citrobacter braakii]MDM3405865.1 TVP38/TMEM64 family protein [Citrobacter sp. Cb022]MDM3447013.1 TVP38/TMEM64 family protein [Citrobacter sp. Cb009]